MTVREAAPTRLPVPLRPAAEVMRLARMGCSHPTRLSFLRVLLRGLTDAGARCGRPVWEINARGVGHAVYRVSVNGRSYSLVAFAHDLPDAMRSDRVIATAWDATFTLVDGIPTPADIARLAANVPLQEAGRIGPGELTLARANRSVRVWAHVIDALAAGRQPDPATLAAVGYLMRTTAVYGAGKFGAADRDTIADRPEMAAPFQAEMLTVWLIRAFTVDLAEHLARVRGGAAAVRLAPCLRRALGVGNSTGLGMAPFLVRHPALLNNWVLARETALARVRSTGRTDAATLAGFHAALAAATANADVWASADADQTAAIAALRGDLAQIASAAAAWDWRAPHPWDRLWRWGAARLGTEGQEALLALLLEPQGALVDDLAQTMSADETPAFRIDGAMPVSALRARIAAHYPFARATDFTQSRATARFWYVSEEKLEPRLGERATEDGAAREQPLGIARAVAELDAALAGHDPATPAAAFVLAHPAHRQAVRRVQAAHALPYAEIHDNLLDATMRPIDLLRCKLAFFGAMQFDPRSDRWLRINLFAGAPFPDELGGAGPA